MQPISLIFRGQAVQEECQEHVGAQLYLYIRRSNISYTPRRKPEITQSISSMYYVGTEEQKLNAPMFSEISRAQRERIKNYSDPETAARTKLILPPRKGFEMRYSLDFDQE